MVSYCLDRFFSERRTGGALQCLLPLNLQPRFLYPTRPSLFVQIHYRMINFLPMNLPFLLYEGNVPPILPHWSLLRNLVPTLPKPDTRIVFTFSLPLNFKHLARRGSLARKDALDLITLHLGAPQSADGGSRDESQPLMSNSDTNRYREDEDTADGRTSLSCFSSTNVTQENGQRPY